MKTLGIIFSNIYDDCLKELTEKRTVASLPFGSKYRQIDFAVSNFSNSGIKNVGVITKYNYGSLMDHLSNREFFDLNCKNECLNIIPPFFLNSSSVYKGKMEALYNALSFLQKGDYENVILSDTNIILNINFKKVLERHIKLNADITAVSVNLNLKSKNPTAAERTDNCNNALNENVYFYINKNKRITDVLISKLSETEMVKKQQKESSFNKNNKKNIFSALNMYVIKRSVLISLILNAYELNEISFERFVLQNGILNKKLKAYIYEFNGIYLKNDNIQNYFYNNMALLKSEVRKELFIKERPILTKVLDEVPSRFGQNAIVENSLISDGCIINGKVKNSIIFRSVTVEENATVENAVIMQNSYISKNAEIYYSILDKNVIVKSGTILKGAETHAVTVKKGEIL